MSSTCTDINAFRLEFTICNATMPAHGAGCYGPMSVSGTVKAILNPRWDQGITGCDSCG